MVDFRAVAIIKMEKLIYQVGSNEEEAFPSQRDGGRGVLHIKLDSELTIKQGDDYKLVLMKRNPIMVKLSPDANTWTVTTLGVPTEHKDVGTKSFSQLYDETIHTFESSARRGEQIIPAWWTGKSVIVDFSQC